MKTAPLCEGRHSSHIAQSKTKIWDAEFEGYDNPLPSMQQASSEGSHSPPIKNLPVEIWAKIFGVATYIPGAYDITDYAAIAAFARDTNGICIGNRFRASMDTKLACSLVCKYWNAIIQPFIFEYLRITSGDQACAVAKTLARVPQAVDARDGPGKWTIRIDLALEGVHSWSPPHDEAMSRIFEHCHNLICLSTIFCSGTFPDRPRQHGPPTEVIQYLRPGQNPELKRLEIKFNGEDVLLSIEAALGNSLEVLWVSMGWSLPQECEKDLLLPKVRTFIATPGRGTLLDRLQLPNLRACVVEEDNAPISSTANTSLIEYVSLFNSGVIFCGSEAWQNLVTLSVDIGNLNNFDITASFQLTRLECVMIEGIEYWGQYQASTRKGNYSDRNRNVPRFQGNLTRIISRYSCPNLQWAKIFRPVYALQRKRPVTNLSDERNRFWNNWVESCSARGIRLGVSNGGAEWSGDQWKEVSHEEILQFLIRW